jgi:hypothetical protein
LGYHPLMSKQMLQAFSISVLCLFSFGGGAMAGDAPDVAHLPASARIPILAWYGPPSTAPKLKEMAEAGFTISFDNRFTDAQSALAGLDAAQQAGVKLLVSCPQLQSDPRATAAKLKPHPALAGYFVRDEPDASLFKGLADWVGKIQQADPDHFCYLNLFPNYATPGQLGSPTYQQHVDDFLKTVPVPFVSFDHYPVTQDGSAPPTLRPMWYENLEIISAASRKANLPFWAFALSIRHYNYPTPTVPQLRVQVFSDLAYGAQAIQYFTYWQVGGNDPPFTEAPVAMDGKRTAVYDRVKQVNAEIQGLAAVFAGSKVLSVEHTGASIPQGTRKYQPLSPVASLRADAKGGGGAVVSLLANGPRRFLVLVNRDINAPLPVALKLDDSAEAKSAARVQKDGSLHALDARAFEKELEPGDVAVLTWTVRQP